MVNYCPQSMRQQLGLKRVLATLWFVVIVAACGARDSNTASINGSNDADPELASEESGPSDGASDQPRSNAQDSPGNQSNGPSRATPSDMSSSGATSQDGAPSDSDETDNQTGVAPDRSSGSTEGSEQEDTAAESSSDSGQITVPSADEQLSGGEPANSGTSGPATDETIASLPTSESGSADTSETSDQQIDAPAPSLPTTGSATPSNPLSPPTTVARPTVISISCDVFIRPAGSTTPSGTPFVVSVSGEAGPVWIRVSWSGGVQVLGVNLSSSEPFTTTVQTGSTSGAIAEVFADASLAPNTLSCSSV